MAKKSMLNREAKRALLAAKYAKLRAELKKQLLSEDIDDDERARISRRFHTLPRDSSLVRKRSRCGITGRPHGFYRRFGLSRNKLREAAMRGDIPGIVKASW
jgi:small subunit ribosomal protein S14